MSVKKLRYFANPELAGGLASISSADRGPYIPKERGPYLLLKPSGYWERYVWRSGVGWRRKR